MAGDVQIVISASAEQAVAGFDRVAKASRDAKKPISELGKAGSDTSEILKKIGEVGPPALAAFAKSAEAAAMPVDELKKKLSAMNNEIAAGARDAGKAAAEQAAAMQQGANVANQLHSALAPMASALHSAGAEALGLEKSLKIAFRGDTVAAGGAKEAIDKVRLSIGATPQDLLAATQALQKFGQFSEENLKRASIAARETGQSVDTVASAIGRFEKFGDSRSANALKKTLGIDPQEVATANGLLDEHGKILLKTAEQRAKFTEAMNKAIDAKNGAGMDDLTSAAQKTKTEFALLQEEIGKNLVKAQNDWIASAGPVVHLLREMPEGAKAAFGSMIQMGSAMTGVAGSALQVGANLKLMGWQGIVPNIVAARNALLAFNATCLANPIILVGAALVSLGVVAGATANQLTANAKALDELNNRSEKAYGGFDKFKGMIGKSADELERMGKTSKDVAQAILVLQEKAANLPADSPMRKQIEGMIGSLSTAKSAMAEHEAGHREEVKKTADAQAAAAAHAAEAWKNFETRRTAGIYATKAEELKALDEVRATMGAVHGDAGNDKNLNKANLERVKLAREANKEIEADAKKAEEERKKEVAERIKLEEGAIQIELAQGKITEEQAGQRYAKIAQWAGISAEQRQAAELKVAEAANKGFEAQVKSLENRTAAGKMSAAEEITQLQQLLMASEGNEKRKEQLEKLLTTAITKELESRHTREVDSLKVRIDAHKATLDELAKLYDRQAQEESDPDKRAKKELDAANTRKEIADHETSQKKELAKAQETLLKDQGKDLEKQAATGKDTAAQQIALVQQRYALERQEIEETAKAEEAKYGRTAAGAELLKNKLADLSHSEKDEVSGVLEKRVSTLQAALDKLNQIDAKQKEMAGSGAAKGPQSLADMVAEHNKNWEGSGGTGGPGGDSDTVDVGGTKMNRAQIQAAIDAATMKKAGAAATSGSGIPGGIAGPVGGGSSSGGSSAPGDARIEIDADGNRVVTRNGHITAGRAQGDPRGGDAPSAMAGASGGASKPPIGGGATTAAPGASDPAKGGAGGVGGDRATEILAAIYAFLQSALGKSGSGGSGSSAGAGSLEQGCFGSSSLQSQASTFSSGAW